MLITEQQLKNIARKMPQELITKVVGYINLICPEFGIMSGDSLHEYLANLLHESKEFTVLEENLNYSAKRLTEVWPQRFSLKRAQEFANNPKKLANLVYGGRMGNEQPNDGWDFRGGGPIQMTGRDMYVGFSTFMRTRYGITKTAQQWAELIRSADGLKWGFYAACWVFAVVKNLVPYALKDQMKEIVERINGGYNGLDDRMRYYSLCKLYIPE